MGWVFEYAGSLGAYAWRWHRGRMSAWLVTVAVLGIVFAVAVAVQLVVWLGQRSLAGQLQSASEMQVFLSETATPQQQASLEGRIAAVPGVQHVDYRSKAQAQALAAHDPQLASLASASDGNPFPASFVVQMSDPSVAGRVLPVAAHDPAADPNIPASYTASQAQRVSAALAAIGVAAWALDAIALGVGVVVALALLRSEVRARRDELRILTLVGVPRIVIRVPLLTQALSIAVAASGVAIVGLLAVGQRLVPAVDASLPFLRLGDPTQLFGTLSAGTLIAACAALLPCALLVRLPR